MRLLDRVEPESHISVIGLLSVKKQILIPSQEAPHVAQAA